MRRETIIPGRHPGNPDVDPRLTERWSPSTGARRAIDVDAARSAFPAARRFETIYPGTLACEEATEQMHRAREHDRQAFGKLAALLDDEDLDITLRD